MDPTSPGWNRASHPRQHPNLRYYFSLFADAAVSGRDSGRSRSVEELSHRIRPMSGAFRIPHRSYPPEGILSIPVAPHRTSCDASCTSSNCASGSAMSGWSMAEA